MMGVTPVATPSAARLTRAPVPDTLLHLLTRTYDVHPDDIAPSMRGLRSAWMADGAPGLKRPTDAERHMRSAIAVDFGRIGAAVMPLDRIGDELSIMLDKLRRMVGFAFDCLENDTIRAAIEAEWLSIEGITAVIEGCNDPRAGNPHTEAP